MIQNNGSRRRGQSPAPVIPEDCGEAMQAYFDGGYFPMPLPAGKKDPPPGGITGHGGRYVTQRDITRWKRRRGEFNIGLRFSPFTIGIDVDAYSGKAGGKTLAELEARLGQLPETAISSARDDGVSGVRWFRLPADCAFTRWKGKAGPGIDILCRHERYAVVWPSTHPDTGAAYRWFWGSSAAPWREQDGPGDPAELPELPEPWRDHVAGGLDHDDRRTGNPALLVLGGEPCDVMTATLGHWLDQLDEATDAGGAHDAARDAAWAVLKDAAQGHTGGSEALRRLGDGFGMAAGSRRDGDDLVSEWARIVADGKPKAAGLIPPGGVPGHWCDEPDVPEGFAKTVRSQFEPRGDGRRRGDPIAIKLELAIADRLFGMQVTEIARQRFRAQDRPPFPESVSLTDLLAESDEEIRYRIMDLLPEGAHMHVAAQAKAGKTTMRDNVVRCLADGTLFLDAFKCNEFDGRIYIIDTEMDRDMARAWLRDQEINDTGKIEFLALRGAVSSFDILDRAVRRECAARLRDAGAAFAVLDGLSDVLSAFGIPENDSSGVGHLLSMWRELLHDAGVTESLTFLHMGHQHERARGSSRLKDVGEGSWKIIRDEKKDPFGNPVDDPAAPRYFSAYGRGVNVPEAPLFFDPATRHLSLGNGSRKLNHAEAAQEPVFAYIKNHPGCISRDLRKAGSGDNNMTGPAARMLEETGRICIHREVNGHYHYAIEDCPEPGSHDRVETVSRRKRPSVLSRPEAS